MKAGTLMELQQLRYFHEVARSEHITNSAKKLHVAQPALTQTIHRLEQELGVKLLERA
ncbi:LysR family transcriptional regulator, partial [Paraeggerthella sp.]|uniref:LysR family transcriptional regulator n=1 Tax=Paraeggerthella sp. TaxID=2897350 RepID=UPI003AB5902D